MTIFENATVFVTVYVGGTVTQNNFGPRARMKTFNSDKIKGHTQNSGWQIGTKTQFPGLNLYKTQLRICTLAPGVGEIYSKSITMIEQAPSNRP